MPAFDFLDKLFEPIKEYNEYSHSALSISTAVGLLFISFLLLKALYHTIQCLRLYFFAQICSKTNYANKYGKWAVVTGATDGIGLEMAKELAKRGQSIIIVGRNEEKLASAKEQVSTAAGDNDIEVLTIRIDMSNSSPENYKQIRGLIDPDNRDIGMLVNNAGTLPLSIRNFHDFDEDGFLSTVNVNCIGLLYFTKMVLPGMIKRGRGCIVNVSSTVGFVSAPYMNVYGPSKAFVTKFSQNLMFEYRNYPIDIINLTPGAIQTKMFQAVYNSKSLHRPSFANPTSSYYARTALNGLSTRISQFAGCFGHALSIPVGNFLHYLDIYNFMLLISFRFTSTYQPAVYKPPSKTKKIAGDETTVLNQNATVRK